MSVNKKDVIQKYDKEGKSIRQVANECGTYPNAIMKILKESGKLRSKSEAQKKALEEGRTIHPTEGRKRSEKTKEKISLRLGDFWDGCDDSVREKKSKKAKQQYKDMTPKQKERFKKAGQEALNKARVEGSKLEHALREALMDHGYKVEFHREHLVQAEHLQMDLYLPEVKTVIEVDGPFHREDKWGEERYESARKQDKKKNSLLISNGYNLIRINHSKSDITKRYIRDILKELLVLLVDMKSKSGEFIRMQPV